MKRCDAALQVRDVPVSQTLAIGLTGEDVEQEVAGQRTSTIVWGDDGITAEIAVAVTGSATVVTEYSYPGEDLCAPRAVLDGRVRITTSDGRLDEDWPVRVWAEGKGDRWAGVAVAVVAPEDVHGSLARPQGTNVTFYAHLRPDEFRGDVGEMGVESDSAAEPDEYGTPTSRAGGTVLGHWPASS
jgi:hypothetical protein